MEPAPSLRYTVGHTKGLHYIERRHQHTEGVSAPCAHWKALDQNGAEGLAPSALKMPSFGGPWSAL